MTTAAILYAALLALLLGGAYIYTSCRRGSFRPSKIELVLTFAMLAQIVWAVARGPR